MNRRKLVLSMALLALFSALGSGISVYTTIRTAVSLEGGNLYSATAERLDSADVLDRAGFDGTPLTGRLFQDLDGSGHLRVVRTLGRPESLPIHEGRQMRATDERVALVGHQVETRSDEGRQWVDYEGQAFMVIGRLGVRADSGLARDVLLQDRDLVVDGPVIVDVEGDAQALPGMRAGAAEPVGGGTDQRTNIDYVSPIVILCGWGLTIFGAGASGLLIAGFRRPVTALEYRLGSRGSRVLMSSVLPLASCAGTVFVTVWGVALASAGAMRSAPEFAAAAGVPLALSIVASAGALAASLWGRRR
ncbi:hypothetical protein [Frigoribacterium sp. PvP032]|uniref:hypothetical protein n=1 Tax=Frigoribacterium sp. PvP032 TaxID=2806589 RepID=UPI001AE7B9C4|nr:hypothetical protein [Frigoribacterium sp. PvP032]MBP1191851.1 hypothetical protein [Frigoribacterium sp. PvP032]